MPGPQGDVHRQGPFQEQSASPEEGAVLLNPVPAPCSSSPGPSPSCSEADIPWQTGHWPGTMRCFSRTPPAEPSLREAKADTMATQLPGDPGLLFLGCQIRLLCSLGTEPRVQPERDKVFEGGKPRLGWPGMRHCDQGSQSSGEPWTN